MSAGQKSGVRRLVAHLQAQGWPPLQAARWSIRRARRGLVPCDTAGDSQF